MGEWPQYLWVNDSDGLLFSKLLRQRVRLWKWPAHQPTAKAAWGALGLGIPEAGGRDRGGRRQERQERPGQECQFRQALDTLRRVHELAMGTDQLFGS